MDKEQYYKIEFLNCPDVDYEYTYCEHIDNIEDFLYEAESSLMDYNGCAIRITKVMLTDAEYNDFVLTAQNL